MSDILVLFSRTIPQDPVTLGNLKFQAYRRASIKDAQQQSWHNTLQLECESATDTEIKLWVLFHSFVLDSPLTLQHYEGRIEGNILIEDVPCIAFDDFSDLSRIVYSSIAPLNQSYNELYKEFVKTGVENLDMAKNMLLEFSRSRVSQRKKIVDPSYWQLVVYFSVVETIIGRQKGCRGKNECEECGNQISHNKLAAKDWIKERLSNIVRDNGIAGEYFDYIWAVREKIRHKTAHEGYHPSAGFSVPDEGHTFYDLIRASGDYEKDSNALYALTVAIQYIARQLLLERIFSRQVFGRVPKVESIRIVAEPRAE